MGPPPRRTNRKTTMRSKQSVKNSGRATSSKSKRSVNDKKKTISFDSKMTMVLKHKKYEVQQQLGAGAFGIVFKAVKTDGSNVCAVKVLDYDKMSVSYQNRFLPREIEALINCKHPNVVEVFDIFRASNKLWIFMEFAGGGDIAGVLKKNGALSIKQASIWFYQIGCGLNYFHEDVKMCHRDIKCDNFLLNNDRQAKLSDFGFAKCILDKNDKVLLSETFCGTVPYEAPQVLEKTPYNGFKYDVWSMGVAYFIMISGRFPFHMKNTEDRKASIANMLKEQKDYPGYIRARFDDIDIDESGQELVVKMLNPSESRRPKMCDIVSNKWLLTQIHYSSQ